MSYQRRRLCSWIDINVVPHSMTDSDVDRQRHRVSPHLRQKQSLKVFGSMIESGLRTQAAVLDCWIALGLMRQQFGDRDTRCG
jgi:hypothetical protein